MFSFPDSILTFVLSFSLQAAHQTEMEDTIRDMMMVRAMSNQRHDSSGSGITQDEDSNDVSVRFLYVLFRPDTRCCKDIFQAFYTCLFWLLNF